MRKAPEGQVYISMIVICCGMIRSASTWSFNACLEILRAARGNPVGVHSDSFTKTYSEHVDRSIDLEFKNHDIDELALTMLHGGDAKAVYTHRDPLDAMVSRMTLFRFSYEEMMRQLEVSMRTMDLILDRGAALRDGLLAGPFRSARGASLRIRGRFPG